jgi:hypothetical protein
VTLNFLLFPNKNLKNPFNQNPKIFFTKLQNPSKTKIKVTKILRVKTQGLK